MRLEPDHKSALEIAISRLSYGSGVLGGVVLVGSLLIITAGVLMRYAFNNPIIWADQITTYALVYVTFIGAPRVLARRRHIAVDIFHTALAPRQGQLLYVVLDAVGVLYCLAFSCLAVQELLRIVARGAEFSDAITIPQWPVYLIIPVGAILLTLQYVANFLADLRTWREAGRASPV